MPRTTKASVRRKPDGSPTNHITRHQAKALKAARNAPRVVMSFRAPVALLATNGLKTKRLFDGIAYTGGIFFPEGIDGPAVVDLKTMRVPKQTRPVNAEHDQSNFGLIGQTTSIDASRGRLAVKGWVYTQKPKAREIIDCHDAGHEWQLSIEADQYTTEKIAAGRTINVNGRDLTGPFTLCRGAYLTAIGFVTVGGDDLTSVSIAASRLVPSPPSSGERARVRGSSPAPSSRPSSVPSLKGSLAMTFEQWLKDLGFDAAALSAPQLEKMRALFDGEQAALEASSATTAADEPPMTANRRDDDTFLARVGRTGRVERIAGSRGTRTPRRERLAARRAEEASIEATRNATRDETLRIMAINRLTAAREGMTPTQIAENQTLAEKAIKENWSANDVELIQLRAGRSQQSVASSRDNTPNETDVQVLEASLLISSGMQANRVGRYFSEQVMNQAVSREHRGATLHVLADRAIDASGERFRGSRKGEGYMTAARNANRALKASGMTTLAISYILENVAQKTLLDAYEAAEAVWKEFCAIRSNVDFKPHSRYSLDFTGAFRKVNASGQLQHVGMTDSKYSSTLETKGAIVTLDRQTWINDDLGAFASRLSDLGLLGSESIMEAVFVLLLAGIGSSWASGNGNYISGTDSALGISGLTAAEAAFANQVKANKRPVSVTPSTLLVGTLLKPLADQLYVSRTLNETTTANKGKGVENTFYNKYKPAMSGYLNNSLIKTQDDAGNWVDIANQSSTLWFLLGMSGNRAPMSVAFLNGAQSPTVETQPAEFEVLGEQWRAFIDYGVAVEDVKLAVCSAGQ